MVEHKKQLFFGYRVKLMDVYIQNLKEICRKKDIELMTCYAAIDALKKEVSISKEKEMTFSQALVDSKMEAKCILEQAEKEAELIKQSMEYRMAQKEQLTEKKIKGYFEKVDQELHRLTILQQKLLDQEHTCKESLYNLFHQISTQVNQVNLKFGNDIVINIEAYLNQFNEIIKQNQELLQEIQSELQTILIKNRPVFIDEQADKIPIFTFST